MLLLPSAGTIIAAADGTRVTVEEAEVCGAPSLPVYVTGRLEVLLFLLTIEYAVLTSDFKELLPPETLGLVRRFCWVPSLRLGILPSFDCGGSDGASEAAAALLAKPPFRHLCLWRLGFE
jgi:hypothetical protein